MFALFQKWINLSLACSSVCNIYISLLSHRRMLPTQIHRNDSLSAQDAARHTAGAKRYKYLRRLLHFRQMDFEFAVWQMLYLFTSPQKVYRNFHYRKQTKDQWARDDPAFLVLLSVWLCGEHFWWNMGRVWKWSLHRLDNHVFSAVSTVGFGLVLEMGFVEMLKLWLWVVFIDCIGVGLLISTLMW